MLDVLRKIAVGAIVWIGGGFILFSMARLSGLSFAVDKGGPWWVWATGSVGFLIVFFALAYLLGDMLSE